MHEVIQSIITEDPSASYVIAEQWLDVALCRRDAAEMASALASLSPEGRQWTNVAVPRSFCEGLVARARGDSTAAEKAFTAARAETERIVREQPDYAKALCVLGMIDAALGHKEDALSEGPPCGRTPARDKRRVDRCADANKSCDHVCLGGRKRSRD
jgi:hypothetical protein